MTTQALLMPGVPVHTEELGNIHSSSHVSAKQVLALSVRTVEQQEEKTYCDEER